MLISSVSLQGHDCKKKAEKRKEKNEEQQLTEFKGSTWHDLPSFLGNCKFFKQFFYFTIDLNEVPENER